MFLGRSESPCGFLLQQTTLRLHINSYGLNAVMRRFVCIVSSHQAAAFIQVYSTYSITSSYHFTRAPQHKNRLQLKLKRCGWIVWGRQHADTSGHHRLPLHSAFMYPRMWMKTCVCIRAFHTGGNLKRNVLEPWRFISVPSQLTRPVLYSYQVQPNTRRGY